MDHINDYRHLLQETDKLSGLRNFYDTDNAEIAYPESTDPTEDEYLNEERQRLKWLCQCNNGHHFDYRDRVRYPESDKTHAPCQGMCPECGSGQISMWSFMLYPRRFNYLGF